MPVQINTELEKIRTAAYAGETRTAIADAFSKCQTAINNDISTDVKAEVQRQIDNDAFIINNQEVVSAREGKATLLENLNTMKTPVGVISSYIGATAPSGWLLCQGQNVSRTTYQALFNLIGTTYGAGDGSTTFTLPNLKGRVPVGLDSTQTEFNALGKTGGAKTHTLTVSEMPSHIHTHSGYSFHWGDNKGNVNIQNAVAASGTSTSNRLFTYQNTEGWNSVDTTGGNQPHNNLQPYITVNYIIKF